MRSRLDCGYEVLVTWFMPMTGSPDSGRSFCGKVLTTRMRIRVRMRMRMMIMMTMMTIMMMILMKMKRNTWHGSDGWLHPRFW